ncbi:MAG: glycerol-3-phosphate 1-O-acyltransferase PlsY [Endomicrobiia bacterium]
MKNLIFLIFSYFLGSFPTAYILVKKIKNVDIRKLGSGNPGATNVVRTSGIVLGIITLLIDFLKGFVAVFIAKKYFSINFLPLVVLFVILGHVFSIFLFFKGGKGVATFFGCSLAMSYKIFLICLLTFVVVLIISRYVSLSSILSIFVFGIIILFFDFINFNFYNKLILLMIPFVIIFRHKENIKRIFDRQENKIF